MTSYDRILRIELPAHRSVFLWGPRKTGKTSYLRARFLPWREFLEQL